MQHQRLPLVLHAPHDEATFASLPYVQELLHLSACVEDAADAAPTFMTTAARMHNNDDDDDDVAPAMTDAQLRDVDAAIVRARIAHERRCELHFAYAQDEQEQRQQQCDTYNKHAATLLTSCADGLSPLLLLRMGVSRALGLPLPYAHDDDTDERSIVDEMVLCRRRVCVPCHVAKDNNDDDKSDDGSNSSSSSSSSSGCAHFFADGSGAASLQCAAVAEWFEDLLAFVRRLDLDVLQVRCVLCDAVGLLHALQRYAHNARAAAASADDVAVDTTASLCEAEVQRVVCAHLRRTLLARSLPATTTHAVARRGRRVPVTRYVRDQARVAALVQRMQMEKANKKQHAQLQAQLERVPLLPVTVYEEQMVDEACEVCVGAVFSVAEATAVMRQLTRSVLTHWRLLCCVLCGHAADRVDSSTSTVARTSAQVQLTRVVEDVLPCVIPPLYSFVAEAAHDCEVACAALWRDAHDAACMLYAREYVHGLEALAVDEAAARTALRAARARAQQRDRADALDTASYEAVQRAFTLRTRHVLQHSGSYKSSGTAGDNSHAAVAAADEAVTDATTTMTATPQAAAAAAETFALEDVERRVCAIEAVVLQQQQQAAATSAGGGGGNAAGGGKKKRLGRA